MKIRQTNLYAQVLLLGAALLCFAIIVVYLYAARPMADDYGRASCQSIVEALSRTSETYTGWSGRWASIGMQHLGWGLIPQLTPSISAYYSAFLAAVWILMFTGSAVIMKLLLGRTCVKTLYLTVIAAVYYFSFYHDLSSTIYWIPGATEGGLAVILMSLAIWLVVSRLAGILESGMVYYTTVFLCLLIAPGCHELAGLTASAFFALMLIWHYFKHDHRVPQVLMYAFIFSVAGTAISVFAPGNSVRAELQGADPSLGNMANACLLIVLRTLRVIMSPQMLLGIPLAAIIVQRYPDVLQRLLSYKKQAFAISGAMSLALIAVAMVYSYKLGGHPAARTVNFFCTSMFVITVPALVITIAGYVKSRKIGIPSLAEPLLCLLLGTSIILGPNLDKGFFSYKTSLIPWIQDQESRHALLIESSSNGQEDVMIEPGPPAPHLLFMEYELSSDAGSWQNQHQARYYRIDRIKMEEQ